MGSGFEVQVLFVCLGNICRSPTAEGVFRALLDEAGLQGRVGVDSAGTGAWHAGESPDSRSTEVARRRGIRLAGQARQVTRGDFAVFDYVVAMDRSNLRRLEELAPDSAARARLSLLRDHTAHGAGQDVPDPYYGGPDGFERVLDICEEGSRALLQHIREQHDL